MDELQEIARKENGVSFTESLNPEPRRKAKAIEFMMVDALLEADPVLRLTDKIWDVNQFVQLDDGVLEVGRGGHMVEQQPRRGHMVEQQPWQGGWGRSYSRAATLARWVGVVIW